jgi:hypothetical protein
MADVPSSERHERKGGMSQQVPCVTLGRSETGESLGRQPDVASDDLASGRAGVSQRGLVVGVDGAPEGVTRAGGQFGYEVLQDGGSEPVSSVSVVQDDLLDDEAGHAVVVVAASSDDAGEVSIHCYFKQQALVGALLEFLGGRRRRPLGQIGAFCPGLPVETDGSFARCVHWGRLKLDALVPGDVRTRTQVSDESGDDVLVDYCMSEPRVGHSGGNELVWCRRVNAYRSRPEVAVLGDEHCGEPG